MNQSVLHFFFADLLGNLLEVCCDWPGDTFPTGVLKRGWSEHGSPSCGRWTSLCSFFLRKVRVERAWWFSARHVLKRGVASRQFFWARCCVVKKAGGRLYAAAFVQVFCCGCGDVHEVVWGRPGSSSVSFDRFTVYPKVEAGDAHIFAAMGNAKMQLAPGPAFGFASNARGNQEGETQQVRCRWAGHLQPAWQLGCCLPVSTALSLDWHLQSKSTGGAVDCASNFFASCSGFNDPPVRV